jgi:hypothetical protein
MGCPFAGESRRGPRARSFRQCPEALFHKALAGALDRDAASGNLLSNLLIAEPFVGFQHNACTGHLACCGFTRADESQERLSLFRG